MPMLLPGMFMMIGIVSDRRRCCFILPHAVPVALVVINDIDVTGRDGTCILKIIVFRHVWLGIMFVRM